jgi:hypothetical protein
MKTKRPFAYRILSGARAFTEMAIMIVVLVILGSGLFPTVPGGVAEPPHRQFRP